jgi:competence protein ComEC
MNLSLALLNALLLLVVLGLGMVPLPAFPSMETLDVGQGDSLLFQEKATQLLVDGGPGSDVLTRLAEEMPWFDRKIEVVVATHFDKDHLEGLTHVLSTYDVGMVLMPDYIASTTGIKKQFIDILDEKDIPYRFAWYGQSISVGSLQFRVMSPIPGEEWTKLSKSKSNNASIIMRADVAPRGKEAKKPMSFLLTADAESGIEKQLLASVPSSALDVDVLKVGHHGSKTSTTPAFLSAASPVASIVSVGAKNTYGHPTPEVLSRLQGTDIFRTDQLGTIRFFFDGDMWRTSCGNKTDLLFSQHLCTKK